MEVILQFFELVLQQNITLYILPILVSRCNLNSSMDEWLNPLKRMRWNYLSIPKLQR